MSKDKKTTIDVCGSTITVVSKQEEDYISLTDMDVEIEQLERQLAKYHQIKQGIMQELLTGRIRLV